MSAQESPCTAPRLQVELDARPEWAAEVPALRTRLRQLEHVDACAEVTIREEQGGVSVTVVSGGRSATRHLQVPSELARTVEALVVLPPPLAETTAVPRQPEPPLAPPRPKERREAQPVIEIGAAAQGRLGGNPLMVGGGIAAFADLMTRHFIIGISARYEFSDGFVSETAPSGFTMDSGAIGVSVGRRKRFGSVNCDVLLSPMLILESEEAFGSGEAGNEGIGGAALDARLNLALRASGGLSPHLGVYAAGDVEVSPHRLVQAKQLDPELPPLPAWSSGLALGLIWGTP